VIALDSLGSKAASGQSIPIPARVAPETAERRDPSPGRQLGEASTLANPVLEKTLDRAVSLSYMSAEERDAVRGKIMQLAADHRFRPDDLALVSLIESDGFNPRASNGRCFGVIQFCDGADRGAATVGYRETPKAITGLPVLEQLDLVSRYFTETGLRDFGRAGTATLDDLYFTVLTPAARNDRRLDSPLPIQGSQASVLKVDGNPQAPITRRSLIQGLWQTARDKLSAFSANNVSGATAQGEVKR